jgi:ABC-type phosphate transport system substrate-binding protein
MRNLKATLMTTASAVVICASSQAVHATSNFFTYSTAFGGGSTAAQIVYRQQLDCLMLQANGSPGNPGPLALSLACTGGADQIGYPAQILYAGTGSGNGKSTFIANANSALGTPSNSVPYTDQYNVSFSSTGIIGPITNSAATGGYDGFQFAGTDDPWNSTDQAAYVAAGNVAKFGNPVMIPTMVLPIALGVNSKDGNNNALNIPGGLNLTRQAFCGLVSGHITKWSNTILLANNPGLSTAGGQIQFVHRQDGSGSTFLLSNAAAAQCATVTGPNNETDPTTVSYALPWTDHTIVVNSGNTATYCPAGKSLLPIQGTDQLNFPDQFSTDQCSGSLANYVNTTNGAIGYASVDFWEPINTSRTNTSVANLQNQYSIAHATTTFVTPNATSSAAAMSETTPPAYNADAITWGLQGTIANPVQQASYSVAGFTWLMLYQCYQNHANGNAPQAWVNAWLDSQLGSSQIQGIVTANGFATIPGTWGTTISQLLGSTSGPNVVGSGGCTTGQTGAY